MQTIVRSSRLQKRGYYFRAELDALGARTLLLPAEQFPRLRSILETICRDRLPQMPGSTLVERMRALTVVHPMPKSLLDALHRLRITANKVLHENLQPPKDDAAQGFEALRLLIDHIYGPAAEAESESEPEADPAQQNDHEPKPAGTEIAVPSLAELMAQWAKAEAASQATLRSQALAGPDLAGQAIEDLPHTPEIRALLTFTDPELRCAWVRLEDDPSQDLLRVWYAQPDYSEAFGHAHRYLQTASEANPLMVNLLEVRHLPDGSLLPAEIVLAPDYLFEVTAVSDVINLKNSFEQSEPATDTEVAHYLLNQLVGPRSDSALARFKGTVANQVFDAVVWAAVADETFDFQEFAQHNLFGAFPFEFSFLFKPAEANQPDPLRQFLEELGAQAEVLQQVVATGFVPGYLKDSDAYRFNIQQVFLESSFFSTRYGLQGRADLLHLQPGTDGEPPSFDIVELKSGKPPSQGTWPNHRVQGLLYQRLLESAHPDGTVARYRSRILYSRPNPGGPIRDLGEGQRNELNHRRAILQKTTDLRNRLAALEFGLCRIDSPAEVFRAIRIVLGRLSTHSTSFIADAANETLGGLSRLDPLEQQYYAAFVRFGLRERLLTKTGTDPESARGQVSLWQTDKHDPQHQGVLTDLAVVENGMSHAQDPFLRLRRPANAAREVNFRPGDQVVVYPGIPAQAEAQHAATHMATRYDPLRTQVFRGAVDDITPQHITVRFRAAQPIRGFFEQDQPWAIEQDVQDHSARNFLQPLTEVMLGPAERRALLLGRAAPTAPAPDGAQHYADWLAQQPSPNASHPLTALQRMQLGQIYASPDYHLVIGPPGTGKTSIYLRHLAWLHAHHQPDGRLLLLAYTNRAVDEICDQLEALALDYIRIGSRQTTPERLKPRLLNSLAAALNAPDDAPPALQQRIDQLKAALPDNLRRNKRQLLQQLLAQNRIVVATLASLSTRSELLRLTPFDTAIVDEASQLVEPPLLRVLMQVRRFVLIGDDRQLPAVVLQPPAQTKLPSDSPLHEIGLTDLRNSYFERLLGCADRLDAPHAITRLCHQGRMHQVVASFPSQQFYGSQLQLSEQPDRRAQQCQALDLPIAPPADPTLAPLATALSQHRLLWLRTLPNHRLLAQLRMHAPERLDDRTPPSHKTNWAEATHIVRVAQLLAAHYRQLGWDDARIADEALGIIASYRNQVAEIRRRLQATEDPALQALAVDTIERYQGSQRRHILASFCVNQPWQLTALCSPHADGQTDRKLNVLLTRAREQLVLVGCAELLCQDPIYLALYQHITQAGAILDARNDLAEV